MTDSSGTLHPIYHDPVEHDRLLKGHERDEQARIATESLERQQEQERENALAQRQAELIDPHAAKEASEFGLRENVAELKNAPAPTVSNRSPKSTASPAVVME